MAKWTFLDFILAQRAPVPPVLKVNLAGKTAVVTGANTGVGFETALHLARMNPAKVVLGCRNRQSGEQAVRRIKEMAGFERVELGIVDQSRFDSVSQFAETVKAENDRIDLLVCGAGVAMSSYEAAPTGWERTIQVNHLGTALLSLLLLPLMERTGREHGTHPRLVVVSSDRHYYATIPDDVLAQPKILERMSNKDYCTRKVMANRYPLSKLLNVLYTRGLAARLPPTSPVVVTTVNPGFCTTGIRRHQPALFRLGARIVEATLGRTAEEGARQVVWAALAGNADGAQNKEVREGLKGVYVSECDVREVADWVLTGEGGEGERRVWDETLEILGGVEPKVRDVASELFSGQT